MSAGMRRSCIPLAYRCTDSWPSPNVSLLSRDEQEEFFLRRKAIELYCLGSSFIEIKNTTGKVKSEVYRLLNRCLTPSSDGTIYGFLALLNGIRVVTYEREQTVIHTLGSGSGGCAGALTQLFRRFPEIESFLINLYLKKNARGTMPEARIGINVIHNDFVKELRKLGLTDNDWPFNTANCGYKSISEYFRHLRENDSQRVVASRSGVEAARRGATGTGIPPLLPTIRPYGSVMLDFHKVDAASVIIMTNEHGEEFDVPLARWHFGLMVEEQFGAALGYCIALELTPSADSALEVVSNTLSSRPHELCDVLALSEKKFLINQLMPDLEFQGFSVLKVDNGWSNAAHDVVNNIIDTVGCAVNFGPTRAWWRRSLIERIFGELTRRGLQRLPSTYGKGPGDTRITNPNSQASKFRIQLRDLIKLFQNCLREHNLVESEGLQYSSPYKCLEAAYVNPVSGFFRQPLPMSVVAHAKLMMHVEEVTVRGSVHKNIRPYFNLDRHKHTNQKLANSFWLIGKKLIVYVDRRLARIVFAYIKDTGEQLGQMIPSGPWAHSDCSWRDRKLLTRSGLARKYGLSNVDPLENLKAEKKEQLSNLTKTRRKKSSRTALEVLKIEAQQNRVARSGASVASPMPATRVDTIASPKSTQRDPFGLNDIPELD